MSKTPAELELDKRLEAFGFVEVKEGEAPSVEESTPQEEASAPESDTVEQDEQPVEEIKEPEPPKKREVNHNWEKREKDAREAQRQLSLEREAFRKEKEEAEAQLLKLQQSKDEIAELLDKLNEAKSKQVAEPVETSEDDPELAEFDESYPDLSKVLTKKTNKILKKYEQKISVLEQKLEAEETRKKETVKVETAKMLEDAKRDAFFKEILDVHPDAFKLGRSPEMKEWLKTQPAIYDKIIFNTLDFDPQDAIEVLDLFKRSKGVKTPRPAAGDMSARVSGPASMNTSGDENPSMSDQEINDLPQLINRIARLKDPIEKAKWEQKLQTLLSR